MNNNIDSQVKKETPLCRGSFSKPMLTMWLFTSFVPYVAGQDYIEGEVLVRLRENAAIQAREATTFNGCRVCRNYPALKRETGIQLMHLRDSTRTTQALIAAFKSDPRIAVVEPNFVRRLSRTALPNDPLFSQQWGLENTGQSIQGIFGTTDEDINWAKARLLMADTLPEVVIAILDSGVDLKHPDLQKNIWVNPFEIAGNGMDDDNNGYVDDIYGYDFAGDDYNNPSGGIANDGPDNDPSDGTTAHGTQVAGIAAAVSDNEFGITGIANAKIMALKVGPGGEELPSAAIIDGMNYVLDMKNRGVNIVAVNGSYGSSSSSVIELEAMQALADAGVIFCAAAGNDSKDNDVNPEYPANYAASNVIAVAASNNTGALAGFSNFGFTTVDVVAPGAGIYSTSPTYLTARSNVSVGGTPYNSTSFTYTGMTDGITRPFYACGVGGPGDFPSAVAGNIALIERGTFFFSEKVANAQAAGAVGVVIYNSATADEGPDTPVSGTLGKPNNFLPAVAISHNDGLALLPIANGTVAMTLSTEADSFLAYDFANGTSFAAPVVTGIVAMLAQHFPNDTMSQRIQRLFDAVEPIPALNGVAATAGRINLAKALDADADQVPDWFETQIGTLATIDDTTDFDHDGVLDIWEFRAGTQADNGTDRLAMLSTEIVEEIDAIELSWTSAPGRLYDVLMSETLETFDVVYADVPATGLITAMRVPKQKRERVFFRIRLKWPD